MYGVLRKVIFKVISPLAEPYARTDAGQSSAWFCEMGTKGKQPSSYAKYFICQILKDS